MSAAEADASGNYTFGSCHACIRRRYRRDMAPSTATPPLPPTDGRSSFRLVVKFRPTGHKGYVWEIVRDGYPSHTLVRRSRTLYATMEEAYAHGYNALGRLRSLTPP
jgi:hypothetical protein